MHLPVQKKYIKCILFCIFPHASFLLQLCQYIQTVLKPAVVDTQVHTYTAVYSNNL